MSGRILFFTKGTAVNPATRYRFLQYLPHLRQAGFEIDIRPLFGDDYYDLILHHASPGSRRAKAAISLRGLFRRLSDLPEARRADLVVVENQLFPYEQGVLEFLLRRFNRKVVIEFDDAIYLTALHEGKLRRTLAKAAHVVVGNEHLARFARQATDRVSIVPTVIDMESYPDSAPQKTKPLRIGWVGTPGTLPYLDDLHAPLRKLAAEIDFEFVVISSRPYVIPTIPCRFVPWNEKSEAREIALLDIGVMPLPDTPWTRGKCGAKLLQYMAAGRAAVASPVGVNARIVRHGENGLLAGTPEKWHESLLALARDTSFRERLGKRARETVRKDYSLQTWGPEVVRLYRSLLSP